MLIEVALGQDGIGAHAVVDGLQQHPATDEALFVGLGGSGIGGHGTVVVGAVLELHPVDAHRGIALTGHDQVGDALGDILQAGRLCEPLPRLVAAELPHLRDDVHLQAGDDLALGRLLADAELGITRGLGVDNEVGALLHAGEVHVFVLEPAAFHGQGSLEATQRARGVHQLCRHITAGRAVAVNLYLLRGLVDAHAALGGLDLLDGAVGIECHALDAGTAALVIARREVVVVVEEIPLPLVFHEAVVVGPAVVGVLRHEDALEVPGPQW